METCPVCEKQLKSKNGLAGHMRFKHAPNLAEAPPKPEALEKYNLPSGNTKSPAIRTVKMVAPQCDVRIGDSTRHPCTEGPHRADWFATCPHDPYFHEQEMPEIREDREFQEDGTYIVTNRETVWRMRRIPNLRQVPGSPRHLGFSISKARSRGWRFPEELGVAPFCQYQDCWSQDLPDRWVSEDYGVFCSEQHATNTLAQRLKVTLEVGDEPAARSKRREQLAKLAGTFR